MHLTGGEEFDQSRHLGDLSLDSASGPSRLSTAFSIVVYQYIKLAIDAHPSCSLLDRIFQALIVTTLTESLVPISGLLVVDRPQWASTSSSNFAGAVTYQDGSDRGMSGTPGQSGMSGTPGQSNMVGTPGQSSMSGTPGHSSSVAGEMNEVPCTRRIFIIAHPFGIHAFDMHRS